MGLHTGISLAKTVSGVLSNGVNSDSNPSVTTTNAKLEAYGDGADDSNYDVSVQTAATSTYQSDNRGETLTWVFTPN